VNLPPRRLAISVCIGGAPLKRSDQSDIESVCIPNVSPAVKAR